MRKSRHQKVLEQSASYDAMAKAWRQAALACESTYGVESPQAKSARLKAASAWHVSQTYANTHGIEIKEEDSE